MTSEDKGRIEKLNTTCKLLEADIQNLTSEIIESELSREQLILELKNARRQLYKEFEKIREGLSDIDLNTSAERSQKRKREQSG